MDKYDYDLLLVVDDYGHSWYYDKYALYSPDFPDMVIICCSSKVAIDILKQKKYIYR